MNLVSLLFGFKGRINRAQFWYGNLGAGFAGILLMFVLGVMFIPTEDIAKTPAGFLHLVSVMGLVIGPPLFLMCWVGLALQTKRFHDRGRSGLWTMLPMLPAMMITTTIVTSLAGGQTPEQAVASVGVWMLVTQAVNIFMLVDLGCMPGKEGANKYGPPPGGGSGSPSGSPIPGTPSKTAKPIPGMGMTSAESAIERAIAAREKQTQAPTQQTPVRTMSASQAAPMRPAIAGSFGRKASN
ncbi:MAG: DUF805 domain-containing protein [Alphaproteobacteria bacterium]|nr:DUF805 domain-containing protein [Alphaproteobacteria bacterium]